MDLVQWIEERHAYWWMRLMGEVKLLAGPMPDCQFQARKAKWAGRAYSRQRLCIYNLSYATSTTREEYDKTIAHEVCHIAAYCLMPDHGSHGDLWQYLFNVVLDFRRGRYHNYDRAAANRAHPLAKKIEKAWKLKRQIETSSKKSAETFQNIKEGTIIEVAIKNSSKSENDAA